MKDMGVPSGAAKAPLSMSHGASRLQVDRETVEVGVLTASPTRRPRLDVTQDFFAKVCWSHADIRKAPDLDLVKES